MKLFKFIGCSFASIGGFIGLSLASLWIYGLVSAFKAAWWIGLICLLFAPIGLIEGIVKFFGGPDLAQKFFKLVMSN